MYSLTTLPNELLTINMFDNFIIHVLICYILTKKLNFNTDLQPISSFEVILQ